MIDAGSASSLADIIHDTFASRDRKIKGPHRMADLLELLQLRNSCAMQ
jgi:hypothetical protein